MSFRSYRRKGQQGCGCRSVLLLPNFLSRRKKGALLRRAVCFAKRTKKGNRHGDYGGSEKSRKNRKRPQDRVEMPEE